MRHLGVDLQRAGFIPVPKVKAENIIRYISPGDLPVKTFILTFNYNLVSHQREKKITMYDIAMGYRDKLSPVPGLILLSK